METSDKVTRYKTIRISGQTEESVREKTSDLLDNSELGSRIEVHENDIQIVLQASGSSEEDAFALIRPVAKEIRKRFSGSVNPAKSGETLEMTVVRLLEKRELTLTTAESCTGGMLAARIINVPGCSEVYREGYITYSNKSKKKLLNVSKGTLKKYGAVSRQTAKEMAIGAVFQANADVSLAITGIAGPDGGTDKKPVGLVYIGCYMNDCVAVEEHHFEGGRQEVREQSVEAALRLLCTTMMENLK